MNLVIVVGVTILVLLAVGAGAGSLHAIRSAKVSTRLLPVSESAPPPGWFLRVLELSALHLDAAMAWTYARRAGVVALVAIGWLWPVLLLAGAIVGFGVHCGVRSSRTRTERRHYDTLLCNQLDAVVSKLAGGSSLPGALAASADTATAVGRDLDLVLQRQRHGQSIQLSLDRWAASRATPGVVLVAAALAIAGESGGSQRNALVSVQSTLRERESLGREIRALGSQARTSALVLAVTPIGFAAFVALVDERIAEFFSTPAGWACVTVGLALDAVGALWMQRLAESLT